MVGRDKRLDPGQIRPADDLNLVHVPPAPLVGVGPGKPPLTASPPAYAAFAHEGAVEVLEGVEIKVEIKVRDRVCRVLPPGERVLPGDLLRHRVEPRGHVVPDDGMLDTGPVGLRLSAREKPDDRTQQTGENSYPHRPPLGTVTSDK